MKECFKCHNVKRLSDFYRHPYMADRHLNKCKDCTKLDATSRFRDPTVRPQIKAKQREYMKTEKGHEISRLTARRHRLRHPDKVRARQAAHRLQKKPCEVCSTVLGVEAHHPDYTRPLDVIWFCRVHHRAQHPEYFSVKEVR